MGSDTEMKIQTVLHDFPRALILSGPAEDSAAKNNRLTQVFTILSQRLNLPPDFIGQEVARRARALAENKKASPLDRAQAHFLLHQFTQARDFALDAGDRAHRAKPRLPAEVIQALELAAFAAMELNLLEDAEKYLSVAAGETAPERDLALWTQVQSSRAQTQYRKKAPQEREAILRDILKEQERAHGTDHVDTLRQRNELANALYEHQQDAAAEVEFRALLAATERVSGSDHAHTQSVRKNLARVLETLQRYPEAEALRMSVVQAQERTLGNDDLTTWSSRLALIRNLEKQGKNAEQTVQYRELYAARRKKLGDANPDTREALSGIAVTLMNQGQNDEAEGHFRQLLEIDPGTDENDITKHQLSRYQMGLCLGRQGKIPSAMEHVSTAHRYFQKRLGDSHVATKEIGAVLDQLQELNAQKKPSAPPPQVGLQGGALVPSTMAPMPIAPGSLPTSLNMGPAESIHRPLEFKP